MNEKIKMIMLEMLIVAEDPKTDVTMNESIDAAIARIYGVFIDAAALALGDTSTEYENIKHKLESELD